MQPCVWTYSFISGDQLMSLFIVLIWGYIDSEMSCPTQTNPKKRARHGKKDKRKRNFGSFCHFLQTKSEFANIDLENTDETYINHSFALPGPHNPNFIIL